MKVAVLVMVTVFLSCPLLAKNPLKTVEYVDIERYLGQWHEIATIPPKNERRCLSSTAEYSMNRAGDLRIVKSCIVNGDLLKRATGFGYVVDTRSNAKLEIQFYPFKDEYWIIELDENYEYVVIGNPDRDTLSILSRNPYLPKHDLDNILYSLRTKHGYDVSKIVFTTKYY